MWRSSKTRRQADAALAERVRLIARGQFRPPKQDITFAELAERFQAAHSATVSPRTTSDYAKLILRLHLGVLNNVPIRRLSVAAIEQLRADLLAKRTAESKVGIRTVEQDHRAAGPDAEFAEKHGLITANPVRHVRQLRQARRRLEPLSRRKSRSCLSTLRRSGARCSCSWS